MACQWCGKPYEAHLVKPRSRMRPRMPCLGLRSGYLEKPQLPPEPPPDDVDVPDMSADVEVPP